MRAHQRRRIELCDDGKKKVIRRRRRRAGQELRAIDDLNGPVGAGAVAEINPGARR
jgi:hypothetical protein